MLFRATLMRSVVAALFIPVLSWANLVEATGDYMYGPETSDAQACRLAVLAARNNALLKKVGEDVSIDQSYACTESVSQAVIAPQKGLCTLNKYLWSQMGGEIQSFKVLDTSISTSMGARTCRAKISAEINKKVSADPAFDFAVTVNANTFRVGEKLKVFVSADQEANLTIFSWIPNASNDGVVEQIFPNQYQTKSLLNAQLTIPNQDYDIVVGSDSAGVRKGQASVQLEHLIFVMSKNELLWPKKMSYDDFSKKVFETDPHQIRIRKKTLSVVAN